MVEGYGEKGPPGVDVDGKDIELGRDHLRVAVLIHVVSTPTSGSMSGLLHGPSLAAVIPANPLIP